MARKLLDLYRERREGGLSRYDVLYSLYMDVVVKEKIKLIDPTPPKTFIEYLVKPPYSLEYLTIISIVVLTILSIILTPFNTVFRVLRFIIAPVMILFLPGYVTIELLYAGEERFSSAEELMLSIGLSITLTVILGLILNFTGVGIGLYQMLTVFSIYIIVVGLLAAYRKYGSITKT